MHRIHIVAVNPRTGTTLLAECMRTSFKIARSEGHEAPVHRLRPCSGVYLTKSPKDLLHIEQRLRLDPRFNVVCLVRDPRDSAVSRHGKRPEDYFVASTYRFKEGWPLVKRYEAHPRFLWVKYEDLIDDPDSIQDRIAARFPFLERTGCFSEFHKATNFSKGSRLALNGVRPIDRTNHGKWRDHLKHLETKLEESGPIDVELIQAGYESDPDWMARCGISLSERAGATGIERTHYRRKNVLKAQFAAIASAAFARMGIPVG